ncbi:MAG: hypothetical protein ING19_11825 [Azospirillum sp.]|nr:hypothetical protein [Azospirillum sp.]MCZ8123681.1 hypothetical protein [Magnetospirillum sp.]
MTLAEFRATLADATPPRGVARPLEALWHAARGQWDAAHKLAQMDEGEADHDWVHAYLHRVEGDPGNARYWYARAKKPAATGSLDEEWARIAEALLR